ncbi:MAG: hypothetical protein AAF433_11295 [Bacteroidota bacterium]
MQSLNTPFRPGYFLLALLLLFQSFFVAPAYALTGGPSQPEFQQLATVGASNLVDPFSGNFQYSIPLFEIGGYPMSLNYSSDHKMEEDASWVGFGWSLSPGAIVRDIRGVPDDFNGDEITRTTSMAPNRTVGIKPGASMEIFGGFSLAAGLNFTYNNYIGFQFSRDLSPSINLAKVISGQGANNCIVGENCPSTSLDDLLNNQYNTFSIGTNINTRSGLQRISYGVSSLNYSLEANKISRRLGSINGSISLGGFTYTPVGQVPRNTEAYTFQAKLGGKPGWPASLTVDLEGFYSIQRVDPAPLARPAYGYLYLEHAAMDANGIMDYNEESGGIAHANTARLPLSYGTPDIFRVSGAGIGGIIRIARNGVGMFRPPANQTNSQSVSSGVEFSGGQLVHPGFNFYAVATTNRISGWRIFNELSNQLGFKSNSGLDEGAFMQFEGEAGSQMGKDWYSSMGQDWPVRPAVRLESGELALGGTAQIDLADDGSLPIGLTTELNPGEWSDRMRRPRANMVSYLTNEQAMQAGLYKNILNYQPYVTGNSHLGNPSKIRLRTNPETDLTNRPGHHISEINIINSSGQRYVYGLPVYNYEKREVTFNASGRVADVLGQDDVDQEGSNYATVIYDTQDASVDNNRGRDHLFDQTETAPYVSANLLTAVLSPDYVDVNGNGPSLDDLGQYVKIGYSQVTGNDEAIPNSMGWRAPMGLNRASFNPGNLADDQDDKASYTYGRKEMWYVHHMQSKTHRAVFYTSTREDARSISETGAVEGGGTIPKARKLDEIRIYTLSDLKQNAGDAVPLKSIRFHYATEDNELSGDLPNHGIVNRGKLTLVSLSITYASNERGEQNPYVFTYKLHPDGMTAALPYQPGMTDRWGNQRPKVTGYLGPQLFPYTIQDRDLAEDYCDVGNLTSIQLPSGGTIEVEYEPDDYAYVQDKRAGRMFRVLRTVNSDLNDPINDPTATIDGDKLYTGITETSRLGIVVEVDELPQDENGAPDLAVIRKLYFEDVEQIYFRSLISLGIDEGVNDEIVTGYAQLADLANIDAQVVDLGNNNERYELYLPLEGVNVNNETGGSFHPFTFAGLEKMRLEIPQLVYDLGEEESDFVEFLYTLVATLRETVQLFQGFYGSKVEDGFCRHITTEHSYIRLADPSLAKLGGGTRVKRVRLNDRWLEDDPTFDAVAEYVQLYEYTTIDPETGLEISSGVAANEPQIGKEENLLVNGQRFAEKVLLAPNNNYYLEGPVGHTFYPGPSVGYSRVSMRTELDESFNQSRPGVSIYEFYTARDFPVINQFTNISRAQDRPEPNLAPFASIYENELALAQGFSITVNDMHGKMKRTSELDAEGNLISSSMYHYAEQEAGASPVRKLANYHRVARTGAGNLDDDYLAFDQEVWVSTTATRVSSVGGGVNANVDVSLPFLIAPSIYPTVTSAETQFNTATITKLNRRFGVLQEVEVTNNGASLSTTNLVWDALTGAPLRNSTENEFGQETYSQSIPAYHMDAHYGMGAAYMNQGAFFPSVFVEDGLAIGSSNTDFWDAICPGDELLIERSNGFTPTYERGFVFLKDGQKYVVREDGSVLNDSQASYTDISFFDIRIIKSGLDNQLNLPAEQLTALSLPVGEQLYWPATGAAAKVLSASVTEYSDEWGNQCFPPGTPQSPVAPPDAPVCDANTVNYVSNRISSPSCGTIPDADYVSLKQDIIDCNYCRAIFMTYLRNGLISEEVWDDYVMCTPGGMVVTDSAGIDDCNFLQLGLPWVSAGEVVLGQATIDDNLLPCESTICSSGPIGQGIPALPTMPDFCFPWEPEDAGNPYLDGRYGNWRIAATYVPNQQQRAFSSEVSGVTIPAGSTNDYEQPLIFTDGVLDSYVPFWNSGALHENRAGYLLAEKAEAFHDQGSQLQTRNALDIPSASQYGYKSLLPVAVAQNARQTDIGVENFDDYNFRRVGNELAIPRHFYLRDRTGTNGYGNQANSINRNVAHTGYSSMELKTGPSSRERRSTNHYTLDCNDSLACDDDNACSCVNGFAPESGKNYYFSFWVARTESLECGVNVASPDFEEGTNDLATSFFVRFDCRGTYGSQKFEFFPEGPIIEGWQRVSGVVPYPENTNRVFVEFYPPYTNSLETTFYIDDFRIQPEESNMTSYVYDPETMRLMAELDENNYATFYEYDDEGQLIRVKRETDRGIMTISEQHTNLGPTLNE